MITKHLYETIREKYGKVASWAVWEPAPEGGKKPTSRMGPHIFNLEKNPSLLETLRNDIVMVGLSFADRDVLVDFANFHDLSPRAKDFKIRHAFWNTPYYGAYMTDVLKNLKKSNVQGVREHLKSHPDFAESQVTNFANELNDLQSEKPLLLVFGRYAYDLLDRWLDESHYSDLILLPHYSDYSHYGPMKKYRDEVWRRIFERTGAVNN
jgi:hypothetical protein